MKTAKEFYEFYEKIPDNKWCAYNYLTGKGKCCALGHLGARNDQDNLEFFNMMQSFFPDHRVLDINDGLSPYYEQPTSKARILAALQDAAEFGL